MTPVTPAQFFAVLVFVAVFLGINFGFWLWANRQRDRLTLAVEDQTTDLSEDDRALIDLTGKTYLAARYGRRLELVDYRADLASRGIEVTSRWLNGQHQIGDKGIPIGEDGAQLVEEGAADVAADLREHFAIEDMGDVLAADVLVAFTEPPRSNASRGGRHVELGMALAAGKRVVVIGPRENLFCYLPPVRVYSDWPAYLSTLDSVPTAQTPDEQPIIVADYGRMAALPEALYEEPLVVDPPLSLREERIVVPEVTA